MEASSVVLVCLLVTCSVWTVQGRTLELNIDDHEPVEVDISVGAGRLPGLCWACKWALNRVKKAAGPNATAESLKQKVLSVCDKIGLLKSLCRNFVKRNIGELIEELSTADDVRTICVNLKACKKKELTDLDLLFYPSEEEEVEPSIEIKRYN